MSTECSSSYSTSLLITPPDITRLHVTELSETQWPAIRAIVKEWKKDAQEKMTTFVMQDPSIDPNDPSIGPSIRFYCGEITQLTASSVANLEAGKYGKILDLLDCKKNPFTASWHIANLITSHLTTRKEEPKPPSIDPWDSVLACQDTGKKLQGIALADKRGLDPDKKPTNGFALAYLMTNPNNIRHKLNAKAIGRVEGAGTQIMLHLMQRALKENKYIWLRPTPNAIPFYEKFGFTKIEPSYYDRYIGERMKLTVDKICIYFEKNPPYVAPSLHITAISSHTKKIHMLDSIAKAIQGLPEERSVFFQREIMDLEESDKTLIDNGLYYQTWVVHKRLGIATGGIQDYGRLSFTESHHGENASHNCSQQLQSEVVQRVLLKTVLDACANAIIERNVSTLKNLLKRIENLEFTYLPFKEKPIDSLRRYGFLQTGVRIEEITIVSETDADQKLKDLERLKNKLSFDISL